MSSDSIDDSNTNDVFNLLKSKSFSQRLNSNSFESESTPKSVPKPKKEKSTISNDFQNFDFSSLQKLLSANHSNSKIQESEKGEEIKARLDNGSSSEELLKALLKKTNNNSEFSSTSSTHPQKLKFGKNQSKNSEITSMEEALKQLKLKNQISEDIPTPTPKKKNKTIDFSGIPLGEIEKQIAMLKSISVKN
jgi:hypothetical protein